MRKAFTMIEIIFVIVIIGIIAAVAIPKLAASRNDATASLCAYEVGQLVHEIGNSYNKEGYTKFKDLTIEDISNIATSVTEDENGILENANTKLDMVGVTYYCAGEAVVKIVCNIQGSEYNLTIEDKNPTTPVGVGAEEKLIKQNIVIAGSLRQYGL